MYLPTSVDSNLARGGGGTTTKSQSGWIYFVCSCPVSWASRKQKASSLSSTEAELRAAIDAGKEGVWLRNVFSELGLHRALKNPITLFEDNVGAKCLAKTSVIGKRTRYLPLYMAVLNEWETSGLIS